jgi:hypothetical protein
VSNLIFVSIVSFAILAAPASSPALAQQFNGTLRGTVQDSSGAVLPAVTVTVVEVATNDSRELTSDTHGRWVLPNLKPGTYRISVAMDGFKTAVLDQVKVDIGAIREVAMSLELGTASETITVTGAGAAIETTSPTLSQTIVRRSRTSAWSTCR